MEPSNVRSVALDPVALTTLRVPDSPATASMEPSGRKARHVAGAGRDTSFVVTVLVGLLGLERVKSVTRGPPVTARREGLVGEKVRDVGAAVEVRVRYRGDLYDFQ